MAKNMQTLDFLTIFDIIEAQPETAVSICNYLIPLYVVVD